MPGESSDLTDAQVRDIVVETYSYLYPLVTMEVTRRQACSSAAGERMGRGPMGAFTHVRQFPTADFTDVVRPNFDTLYSIAWLDLAAEPWLISAPASGDRYHLLPMLDMWSDVFACPGTRTTGNGPIEVAVCPPGWQGGLPDRVERIDAPTPTIWVVGRTQTNGPADYPAVAAFQDQLDVRPLSARGGDAPAPQVVELDGVDADAAPLDQVNGMSGVDLLSMGLELMGTHPPHLTDWSQVARMRRIGLVPGRRLDPQQLAPAVRAAIEDAPATALALLAAHVPRLAPAVDGWMSMTDSVGVYGNSYVTRASLAMIGLGANPPEDAVYPILLTDADGAALDGAHRYVLHFDADGLPPVDAFWSVTMYDGHGVQVRNEIDRFAIGDRDPLTFNPDGSLDLYLQTDRPDDELVSNWLPATSGPLGVTMRLYAPRPAALDGTWTPPPVRRVD